MNHILVKMFWKQTNTDFLWNSRDQSSPFLPAAWRQQVNRVISHFIYLFFFFFPSTTMVCVTSTSHSSWTPVLSEVQDIGCCIPTQTRQLSDLAESSPHLFQAFRHWGTENSSGNNHELSCTKQPNATQQVLRFPRAAGTRGSTHPEFRPFSQHCSQATVYPTETPLFPCLSGDHHQHKRY